MVFWNYSANPVLAIATRDLSYLCCIFYSLTTAKYCIMPPRRHQQTRKVAAAKENAGYARASRIAGANGPANARSCLRRNGPYTETTDWAPWQCWRGRATAT